MSYFSFLLIPPKPISDANTDASSSISSGLITSNWFEASTEAEAKSETDTSFELVDLEYSIVFGVRFLFSVSSILISGFSLVLSVFLLVCCYFLTNLSDESDFDFLYD